MTAITPLLDRNKAPDVIRRTLDHIDPRLMAHGARVASLVSQMLGVQGGHTCPEHWNYCFLAMVHDLGAYKTEEIDRMIHFETSEVWAHSIYGYLFLKRFSPLSDLAAAILFHHTSWSVLEPLEGVTGEIKLIAQLIHLADRLDLYSTAHPGATVSHCLQGVKAGTYSPQALYLARQAGITLPARTDMDFMPHNVPPSMEAATAYFTMLGFAIDFRSAYTVTHNVTTTAVSYQLGRLLHFSENDLNLVTYGAILHDLGKIGVPVEILEYPGKLNPEQMSIMRTHADLTAEILGDAVCPEVLEIAWRHHEKLDGSGYPRGLSTDDLTMPQRVVAIADIISALLGRRSYKEAFAPARTVGILNQMAQDGLIDPQITALCTRHFDSIMAAVARQSAPVLESYHTMQEDFQRLSRQFSALG